MNKEYWAIFVDGKLAFESYGSLCWVSSRFTTAAIYEIEEDCLQALEVFKQNARFFYITDLNLSIKKITINE